MRMCVVKDELQAMLANADTRNIPTVRARRMTPARPKGGTAHTVCPHGSS